MEDGIVTPEVAREVATNIVHPYFAHDEADALKFIRQLTRGLEPGQLGVEWESDHTDLGWITITTWLLSVRGPWGVLWTNYDGDGTPTDWQFIHMANVEAVEIALREVAGG